MSVISVHTLGCKVNQCDADALISTLNAIGHTAFHTHDFSVPVDVFVINTCTVTGTSDKKSRQMLRRARKNNPNALVAMCGCMARNSTGIDGVDFVFDAREPENFIRHLARHCGTESGSLPQSSVYREAEEIPGQFRSNRHDSFDVHGMIDELDGSIGISKTRSFIKIQDGCDRFCSYCIVPHVRGAIKSRPLVDILREAETLIECGTAEIVLTGIQVASYGNDISGEGSLSFAVEKVAALPGLGRLRLSSIDPTAVTTCFLEAIAASSTLCPHFHLSLQSGCDTTLEKMNRRYTTAEYANAATALRNLRPHTALTTDVIVGFPGESDAHFAQSLEFVRKMDFAQIHVFEFSPREGTPAASFAEQVPQKIKSERGKIMRDAAIELQRNFLKTQVGRTIEVIFEKEKSPGIYIGTSENYCTVQVESSKYILRQTRNVTISGCSDKLLKGEMTHGNPKNQRVSARYT